MVFVCLMGAGVLNNVNAAMKADCNAAQIAAYDSAKGAGLSHDAAVDLADDVYQSCAGIK